MRIGQRMATSITRSRTDRLLVAGAVGIVAITGAAGAMADPVALCTSDVVDGVETDYCVGNPNAAPSLKCRASTWSGS